MFKFILFLLLTTVNTSTRDFMDDKLSEFLQKIKMLESTGGLNTDHAEMQGGIHAGQSAIGAYGLMPNTIQELVNRKRLEQKQLDPDYQSLYQHSPEEVKALLEQKPELQEILAQQLGQRLLNKNLDPERAAYGWNQGHNIPVDRITPEKLDQSQYVQRFRALRDKLGQR